MTYFLLTLILASGAHIPKNAYGSVELCERAAQGREHTCTKVLIAEYR